MDHHGWKYLGDVNLREGGFYWRETSTEGEVDIFMVTPLSSGGLPDNMFRIQSALIDLGSPMMAEARLCSGIRPDAEPDTGLDVAALLAYEGIGNEDFDFIVRIGPVDELWNGIGEVPEPWVTLRAGTSLRKWLEREYLHPDREAASRPAASLGR